GGARADATDDVAFGEQLLVSHQRGATRHAELGRQGSGRRQSHRRRELAAHDSLAQALVDLLVDGATGIGGDEHRCRATPKWYRFQQDKWLFADHRAGPTLDVEGGHGMRIRCYATLYLRLAVAAGFLTSVSDRFGLWGPPGAPNVAWGGFQQFGAYTA